jgi:hypothetical protein
MADLTGPRIISQVPGGDVAGTVGYVDVTFSEPINAASFTTADVTLGFSSAFKTVTKVSDSRFRIGFSGQTALGEHGVTIGPQITDLADNLMDQNRDGVCGQPADAYQGAFTLADVDLEVSNLSVAATELWAGDVVHVSWDGANTTGYELFGSWTDAVYLSTDDTWDFGDILLGTVPHTGGLAAGAAYSASIDVNMPGVMPGDYRIIVRADMYNQEKEAGRDANNVVASQALPLGVHRLTTDNVPVSGAQSAADRADYYVVQAPQQESVKLTMNSEAVSGANEVYVKYGSVPSRQDYDYRVIPASTDAELVIPGTYDGG